MSASVIRAKTHTHTFNGPLSGTTRVSRYQKGKTNLDFTEARDSGGSGISWAICKSAPRSRQITTPTSHHSIFTGRMPFLPPNQQRQSTEGKDNCREMGLRLLKRRCRGNQLFLFNPHLVFLVALYFQNGMR